MAPLPPSNPLKGPGGHDHATTPQDFPSDCSHKNNNKKKKRKKKSKAKKPTKPKNDQELEVSEIETDTTANIQTDLDTDADAEVEVEPEPEPEVDVNEMPKRPPPPPKRDVDISMILNWQQRLQFDALNQTILGNIEAQVMKPFNYLDHPVAKQHRVKIWNFGPTLATNKNAEAPSANGNPAVDTTKAPEDQDANAKEDSGENNTATRIIRIDADNAPPAVPSMNLLKEEATQYFNKWKAIFLKRCNDLIVPKQSISDAGTSRQGQGALRGGGTGAGRGGRHPQEGTFPSASSLSRALHVQNHGIMAFAGVVVHQTRLAVDESRELQAHSRRSEANMLQ